MYVINHKHYSQIYAEKKVRTLIEICTYHSLLFSVVNIQTI